MFNSGLNNIYPAATTAAGARSLLSALKKINFSNVLNTAQKTLNVANQAIPLIYQVKPLINNAKTVFKIMGAVKDDNPKTNNIKNINSNRNYNSNNKDRTNNNYTHKISNSNPPQFFI